MPLPPPLTDEQRRKALEKAAIARRKRAELKEQLKSGRTTLRELLDRTGDEIVGKMKVSTVLESLPGPGEKDHGKARHLGVPPHEGSRSEAEGEPAHRVRPALGEQHQVSN
jgi:hypothetical protein